MVASSDRSHKKSLLPKRAPLTRVAALIALALAGGWVAGLAHAQQPHCVRDGIGTLSANISSHVHSTAAAPPSTNNQPIPFRQAMDEVRAHVRDPHLFNRAAKTIGNTDFRVVRAGARSGETIGLKATKGVVLEPTRALLKSGPAATIERVEILNADGTLLGTAAYGKSSPMLVPADLDPSRRIRIVRSDGTSLEWAGGMTPPAGYRFEIKGNGEMRNSGFYGGHTRAAWNETLAAYGDLIHEKSVTRQSFFIPGRSEPIHFSQVAYDFGPAGARVPIKVPKGIFDGPNSVHDLNDFEKFVTPEIERAIAREPDNRMLKFDIQVKNGQGADIKITLNVYRDVGGPTPGKIRTWFVGQ